MAGMPWEVGREKGLRSPEFKIMSDADIPEPISSGRVNRRLVCSLGLAAGAALLPLPDANLAASERRTSGNNSVLGHGGVHHVAIRTRDWNRTLSFYQKALGFSVKLIWEERNGTMSERLAGTGPKSQRWAYLDSGDGTYIEVFEDLAFVAPASGATDPVQNSGSAIVHFALRTSRVDEVCKNARGGGAIDVISPVDYTLHTTTGQGLVVVRLGFLQGPNGEWIELLQNAP
jgi:glyoxylase I family protein